MYWVPQYVLSGFPLTPRPCYTLSMALFHLSAKIIGRQGGRLAEKRAEKGRVRISASNTVAAAAYRSGQELHDESTGLTYSYARAERVMHTEILAPADAPAWAGDRAALWNSVEATERRKDSQLAREIEVALPAELDLEQQRQLVRDWVAATFTPSGAVVDVAIHHDKDDRNPHAHLMTSMRSIGPEGWSKQKLRQWEERSAVTEWRASWADHVNQALERAGHEACVDHRSYAEQDAHLPEELRREPTRKVGPWAKGRDRDRENRAIAERNRSRLQQVADLAKRAAAPVRQAVETVKAAFAPAADRNPKIAAARAAARDRGPTNEKVAPHHSGPPAPVDAVRQVAAAYAKRRDGRYDLPDDRTPGSSVAKPAKPAPTRPTPQAAVPSPSKAVYQPTEAERAAVERRNLDLDTWLARNPQILGGGAPPTPKPKPKSPPQAAVPSPAPPPRAAEPELTDEEIAALKARRDRGRTR